MTAPQLVTLIELHEMLKRATDNGLLDEIAAFTHPDNINSFCDAVQECFDDSEG